MDWAINFALDKLSFQSNCSSRHTGMTEHGLIKRRICTDLGLLDLKLARGRPDSDGTLAET